MLAAACLLVAAWQPTLNPAGAAEAAATRRVQAAATAVDGTWQRLVRRHDWWAGTEGAAFLWNPTALPVTPAEPQPMPDPSSEQQRRFDLLLEVALQEGQQGRWLDSWQTLEIALRQEVDAGRRGTGRLRAIQAARQLDRPDLAAAQWAACLRELRGAECGPTGVSLLLYCGLAVVDLLESDAQTRLRQRLTELWCQGQLTLPEVVERGDREGGIDPPRFPQTERYSQLANRLTSGSSVPELVVFREQQRTRALATWLPAGLPEVSTGTGPTFLFVGSHVLVAAMTTEGWVRAAFHPRPVVQDLVQQHLNDEPGFDGFVADWDGDQERAGERVRAEPVRLEGPQWQVTIRHPQPRALGHVAERQARRVRLAFLVVALLCGGGGMLAWWLLRRDRRVQELKGRFIASVSHELRTPLSTILLMTENLLNGAVSTPEKTAQYHQSIHREGTRLRRLVDDVLDFSRLERGEGARMRREVVSLQALVADLCRETARRVQQAGIRYEEVVEVQQEAAFLDADAIRRALQNLVDNALKYSGGDALRLEVRDGSSGLEIIVRDYGCGIAATDRRRLLLPFQRGAGEDAPHHAPGTGLGLAIVQAIAEGHDGELDIRTASAGPGCEVELNLKWELPI